MFYQGDYTVRIFTIDFTTFTNGASMIVHDSGQTPQNLGTSQRPLDTFLNFSKDKAPGLVIVRHFKEDKNAELIKTQLRTRGYNVQEFIVGG